MRKVITFISFLSLLLIAVGCNPSSAEKEKQNAGFTIYTSIYPIQYVVEEIIGASGTVNSVYPPGVDAHTYEPTSKEITAIADSDAFIYLGAGMEGFAETAAESLRSHDIAFIELGKREELFHTVHGAKREDRGHNHSDHDPHIWLDPLRMIEMAEIIKKELTNLDPDHKELYMENFNMLKENMMQLDKEFEETFLAKTEKHIIVSHAAYGCWEERYGIKQIAISGLSSGNEPSQKELTKIVDLAKDKKLKYVIFEQNGSDQIATIIQQHIRADALYIHNLEVLTDQDIDNNEDYLSLMKKNLEVLDKATN